MTEPPTPHPYRDQLVRPAADDQRAVRLDTDTGPFGALDMLLPRADRGCGFLFGPGQAKGHSAPLPTRQHARARWALADFHAERSG